MTEIQRSQIMLVAHCETELHSFKPCVLPYHRPGCCYVQFPGVPIRAFHVDASPDYERNEKIARALIRGAAAHEAEQDMRRLADMDIAREMNRVRKIAGQ